MYGFRIKIYEDKGNNKRRVRFGVSQFFYSVDCLHSFYIAFSSFSFGFIYIVLAYQRLILHDFKVTITCCQFLNFGGLLNFLLIFIIILKTVFFTNIYCFNKNQGATVQYVIQDFSHRQNQSIKTNI